MEIQNILNKTVGNTEQPKSTVEPKVVKIVSWITKDKDKDGKAMKIPLLQAMVKHPDKDDLLILSKVKDLDGEKTSVKGFWVKLDDDGNFFKGSAIALVLNKLGCKTLEETCGKDMETVAESKDSPYLCFKAY